MSRVAARFTQADVARAIRAAQQTNAGEVRVERDGAIVILIKGKPTPETQSEIDPAERAVL